jgi:hypothetical protein
VFVEALFHTVDEGPETKESPDGGQYAGPIRPTKPIR